MNDEQQTRQHHRHHFDLLSPTVCSNKTNLWVGRADDDARRNFVSIQGFLDSLPAQSMLSSTAGDADFSNTCFYVIHNSPRSAALIVRVPEIVVR